MEPKFYNVDVSHFGIAAESPEEVVQIFRQLLETRGMCVVASDEDGDEIGEFPLYPEKE